MARVSVHGQEWIDICGGCCLLLMEHFVLRGQGIWLPPQEVD